MNVASIARPVVFFLFYAYVGLVSITPVVYLLRVLLPVLTNIPKQVLALGLALGLFFAPIGTRIPAPSPTNYQEIALRRRRTDRLKLPPERIYPLRLPLVAWEIIDD